MMATIAEALAVAVGHHQAGRLEQAGAIYRQILAIQPDNADALHLFGLVMRSAGRFDDALALITRAIALQPGVMAMHQNLGNLLKAMGRDEAALDSFRQALVLEPDHVPVLFQLAVTLHTLHRQDEAIPLYRRILERMPGHIDALYNLGVACQNIGRLDEAVAAYRHVLKLKPDHAVASSNLSATLRHQARLDDAIGAARRALAIEPAMGEAHKNLAFALLLKGAFAEGLEHYEGRRQAVDGRMPELPGPEWDGGPLDGRTVLLRAEQGLGDTIQFIRYARLVRERGGRVIFLCPAPLASLLGGVAGIDMLVPFGQPVPRYHVHAPLMSLPRLLGTRLDTIPADVPYIVPDPALVDRWAVRMAPHDMTAHGGSLRVGLVWAGNPGHRGDRLRSQHLANFLPLMTVPDTRFFSIQMGVGRRDLEDTATPANFTDLGAGIRDFADTAAIMANLDLMIAVDTSVAHLAGALAKPVWIVLPLVPDWRWMMERTDSPWYPTARLFRQRDGQDFADVFARMEVALRERAAGG